MSFIESTLAYVASYLAPPVLAFASARMEVVRDVVRDLANRLYLLVHDIDGTVVPSYKAMRIVDMARNDIPALFDTILAERYKAIAEPHQARMAAWEKAKEHADAAPEGAREHLQQLLTRQREELTAKYQEDIDAWQRVSAYTDSYFADCKKGDKYLCPVDQHFLNIGGPKKGHKYVLHTPLWAFDRVMDAIIADYKNFAFMNDGDGFEQKVREAAQVLRNTDYALEQKLAHIPQEGFVEALNRTHAAGAFNALYTNTEAFFTMIKMMELTEGTGSDVIDIEKIALCYAKIGDSEKHGVKWDGSREDCTAAKAWLEKEGHVFTPESAGHFEKVHARMRAYKGEKGPEVLQLIIKTLTPAIKEAVKAAYGRFVHFVMGPGNVAMFGESLRDAACTFRKLPEKNGHSDADYYRNLGLPVSQISISKSLLNPRSLIKLKPVREERPRQRIAVSLWHEAGAFQPDAIRKTDTKMRGGKEHLPTMKTFEEAGIRAINDHVLPRGYRSFLQMVDKGRILVGLPPVIVPKQEPEYGWQPNVPEILASARVRHEPLATVQAQYN